MRISGRLKGKGSKYALLLAGSCSLNFVLILSLAFFLVGFLRARTGSKKTDAVQVGAVNIFDPRAQELHFGSVLQSAEATTNSSPTVNEFQPFAAGETGQAKVECVTFQLLSWKPRAYIFPKFANASVCERIVEVARKSMSPSGLALREGETMTGNEDVRTSSGTFLTGAMDPALAWVEQRMARVTGVPTENGEAFNVLRYRVGQKYQAHMDTFDPKEFGPQETNRIASFLLYLTDVEEGGETVFPNEGGRKKIVNFGACEGLKVKPKKGDALLFWSMTPERKIDEDALHAGCPVTKGEKWVATKWIRDGHA